MAEGKIDPNRILKEQTEEDKKITPEEAAEMKVLSEDIKKTHPLIMETTEKK